MLLEMMGTAVEKAAKAVEKVVEEAVKEAKELPEQIGELSELDFLPEEIGKDVLGEASFPEQMGEGVLESESFPEQIGESVLEPEPFSEQIGESVLESEPFSEQIGEKVSESTRLPDQIEDNILKPDQLLKEMEEEATDVSQLSEKKEDKLPKAEKEESAPKKGGSYGEVYKKGEGSTTEVHHIPADSSSPLDRKDGPAIKMEKEDHKKTISYGSSEEAQRYRQAQKELIEQGKFEEAVQMDIDDIRENFGDKYDDAIAEMQEYIDQLKEEGKI